MDLSRTVSEIDGDFSRKSQNFPTPLYFAPPLKGLPLELGTYAGSHKTRMTGLSSAVWIECTNVTDRRTDRQTDRWTLGHSKDRAYGKNEKVISAFRHGLCGDNLLTTNRLPQRSLSSQSLGEYWQLNQIEQPRERTHITQTNVNTNVALINRSK